MKLSGRVSFKEFDHGMKEFARKLRSRAGVRIGIFDSETAYIAAIHERGVSTAGRNKSTIIPQRSWLVGYIDENRAKIQRRMENAIRRGMQPRHSLKAALDTFGSLTVGEIQERISDGINPPNAQSTIDRKKSSKPLIDRGILRSSITWISEEKHGI